MKMKQIKIIVGNALVGDAFWTWKNFLYEPNTFKTAVCHPYNVGAVQAMQALTKLQIDRIEVIDKGAPFMDLTGYEAWHTEFAPPEEGVEFRYFDANHSLLPMPVRPFLKGTELDGCCTMQLDSVHVWKRVPGIPEAVDQTGLFPVTILQGDSELRHGWVIKDMCLTEVGKILMRARCHVGINSSVTVLAMLLGVPTVMVGAGLSGDFTEVPDTVRLLDRPSVDELAHTIRGLIQATDETTPNPR